MKTGEGKEDQKPHNARKETLKDLVLVILATLYKFFVSTAAQPKILL